MLGYGYDTKTNEIIFDDTYNHDRRMTWGGSYYYSSRDRELEAVTTVAFDISRLTAISAAEADFDGNGWSDTLLVHDAGYCGAWMTTGESDVIEWRDLSMVNSGWSVFGTGHVYGSKRDEADIFVTDGKILGAWTMENGAITGWQGIETFDPSSADVLGLGDFNADGASDVLMRSKSATGDLGFYLTNGTGWQYLIGLGPEWEVAGVGDLDGNGYDDVIIRHEAGYCGAYLLSEGGKKAEWLNLDMLDSSMELIGCGDVNGDGCEDIFLRKGEWLGCWILGDTGVTDSWGLALMDTSSEVQQLGDYNGDGITDLLVRTAGSDVGAFYVAGEEKLTWEYFQGLGSEWTTKYSAQIC